MCPSLTVLWDRAIHRLSFVACRASRTAQILTLEVLVEAWTVPAGFPHIDVPFSNASDFQKFESHLSFYFYFYFLPDPGDGYIPRRRALDAEHTMLPSQWYVPISRVNVCFSYFLFKRKIVESVLKVHRIELCSSPQSWANPLGHDFFGFSIRRASRFRHFFI